MRVSPEIWDIFIFIPFSSTFKFVYTPHIFDMPVAFTVYPCLLCRKNSNLHISTCDRL
jgi:hypothetical protein